MAQLFGENWDKPAARPEERPALKPKPRRRKPKEKPSDTSATGQQDASPSTAAPEPPHTSVEVDAPDPSPTVQPVEPDPVTSDAAHVAEPASTPTAAEPMTEEAQPAPEPPPPPQMFFFDPWENNALPDFPLAILPEIVRNFVETQSAIIGCDPSGLAIAALANFSGAIDHRTKLKMQRHGSCYERSALWVLLVGDPSTMKTPVINLALKELEEYALAKRKEYSIALMRWEANGKKKEEQPKEPTPYIAFDVTMERLGELLARDERGILIKRDELAGWIGDMDRYGGRSRSASDRAFWLKTYDGGAYSMERVMRGGTYIGNASCSILGGIQLDRLIELKGDRLQTDGLLQRFLPVIIGPSKMPKDEPTASALSDYAKLTRELLNLEPQELELSDEAYRIMREVHQHLHDLEKASAGAAYGFQGYVGKLRGVAGRLAVILHMITERADPINKQIVSGLTMLKVQELVIEFLLPHASEFYRSAEVRGPGDRLQALGSYILTSKKAVISARDLVRNATGFRGLGLKEIKERLAPFISGGWLKPADPKDPDNNRWNVDPALAVHFEERRELEERQKQALAKLMHTKRKPVQ
jgi:hypothetical protein